MTPQTICPICGGNLISSKSGITTCEKCDYYCRTIDPHPQDYSIHCIVCDAKIQSGQLCNKCKETMLKVNDQLKCQNHSKK